LDEEKSFDAINYDVGQPLGQYYIFDDSSGYTKNTVNILKNGGFEMDDNYDENPDYWLAEEPVELDYDIKYEGKCSAKMESNTIINNINSQSVTLEPSTTYTLSGWIKTENITEGQGAQLFPYDFDDLQENEPWIAVKGTTDWTFYSMTFTTGSDTQGRIKYRIKHSKGTVWFDDFHLTKGSYDHYTVFARDFQNATVLLRPPQDGNRDNTITAFNLDGYYRPIKVDGTLGTSDNTIELRNGEGAILVREEVNITTSEPRKTPEFWTTSEFWLMIIIVILVVLISAFLLMKVRKPKKAHSPLVEGREELSPLTPKGISDDEKLPPPVEDKTIKHDIPPPPDD
jgi:hypothetical protein